jgi:uncharacterized protein (TIGR00255 family)
MTISGMTGFSAARGNHGVTAWTWETKSVNGRGLDVRVRLPAGFESLEEHVRQSIAKRFKRGSFQINLTVEAAQAPVRYRINEALLDSIVGHCQSLVARGVAAPPAADGLLALRGVLEPETGESGDAEREAMLAAVGDSLGEALSGLGQARLQEGAALARILGELIDSIAANTAAARVLAEAAPAAIEGKFRAKLDELLRDLKLDPARLAQEAALLAIKADVREELDRLEAHVAEARSLLKSGSGQGRRLDFLAQEFNREANTLCSKSTSTELTRIGLDLKTTVDQLREQAQNVE